MPYDPILPEGFHLGNSRKSPGDASGNIYDEDGNPGGPAAWRWVDSESVEDRRYEEDDETDDAELGAIVAVAALVAAGALSVLAIQAIVRKVRSARQKKLDRMTQEDLRLTEESNKESELDSELVDTEPNNSEVPLAQDRFAAHEELLESVRELVAEESVVRDANSGPDRQVSLSVDWDDRVETLEEDEDTFSRSQNTKTN